MEFKTTCHWNWKAIAAERYQWYSKTSPSWKSSLIGGQPVSPGYDLAPHAEPESSVIPHYHRPFGGSTDVIVNNINRIVSNRGNIRLDEETIRLHLTSCSSWSSRVPWPDGFEVFKTASNGTFCRFIMVRSKSTKISSCLDKSMGFLLISN